MPNCSDSSYGIHKCHVIALSLCYLLAVYKCPKATNITISKTNQSQIRKIPQDESQVYKYQEINHTYIYLPIDLYCFFNGKAIDINEF